MTDPRLERWLTALLESRGLTARRDLEQARRVHLESSLRAVPIVERFQGPIVDVGSGGGAPGIPLAAALPNRQVTLLEASIRKCLFLERWAAEFPNIRVVRGRAEEQPIETYGVAVAQGLAPPPVAAEWCLPLVETGGAVVLLVGPTARAESVARVSERLGGAPPELEPGVLVIAKIGATPPGFPRRPGVARKHPLG